MKIMKFWKYLLSLAVVSFALTACLKGDGWEEENNPQPDRSEEHTSELQSQR